MKQDKDKERQLIRNSTAEFLIFTGQAGEQSIEARYENETIWLTQKLIAALFSVSIPTINEHLKNIFDSGELDPDSVIRKFRITATDGKSYSTKHYNLDAIISVGYRVNSVRATQFRQWATQVLREFAIKGYVLDKKRMENGAFLGEDYFERLLEEIREIRLSERRFYQKITDIYATSVDYNKIKYRWMLMNFLFDENKAISAVLFIAQALKEQGVSAEFHKIFKILYFAEMEHLADWGRPITGDHFVAMEAGPVPSKIYDILKSQRPEKRDDCWYTDPGRYKDFFEVFNYDVTPKKDPDMDEFSKSDLECLSKSIEENAFLTFGELCDKSHGEAWKGSTPNREMSFMDIAKEGGANEEMKKYISLNAENSLLG